ncbi:hypothetical protein ACJX0J_011029, partial [Zea mays]
IKPETIQCGLCGTKLCLVAQVHALVAKLSIEERIIFVLVCLTPECGPQPQRHLKSNGPSTILPEEQNDKNKIPEINSGDFDLDALAEALEQSATLASNSKKKNKSKHANAPVKRPVLKAQACDLSIPVLSCFTYIMIIDKGTVGSNISELVLDKETMDAANDGEEKWEGEKYEYHKAIDVCQCGYSSGCKTIFVPCLFRCMNCELQSIKGGHVTSIKRYDPVCTMFLRFWPVNPPISLPLPLSKGNHFYCFLGPDNNNCKKAAFLWIK